MTSTSDVYEEKRINSNIRFAFLSRIQAVIDQHPWLLPTTTFSILVLLLWLPVGFYTTGLVEEWAFYNLASQGVPLVPSSAWSTAISDHTLRPFVALAWQIGYWITPDSFLGLNLLMMAIFVAKALSFYALLRLLLPESRVFALLTAALFLLYPADSITMMVRGISIHLALLTYLFAAVLLVSYWKRPRWYLMPGIWLSLTISLGIYELSYLFIVPTPLLLLTFEKRISRRLLRVGLLWYLPMIGYLIWISSVLLRGTAGTSNYQGARISESLGQSFETLVQRFGTSIQHMLNWHFLAGWRRAFNALGYDVLTPLIASGVALLFAMAAFWQRSFRQYSSTNTAASPVLTHATLGQHSLQIALLGFLIIGVAYGPFTILNFYFLSTDRVFYYSAVGAALCVMALLYFVTTQVLHSQALFIIAGGTLIGITAAGAIVQHHHAADWSREQQRLFASVIRTVPQLDEGATLIVYQDQESAGVKRIDGYNHPLFYIENSFSLAMQYLYGNASMNKLHCDLVAHLYPELFTYCREPLKSFRADQLVLLEYNPVTGESVILEQVPEKYGVVDLPADYNPYALIDRDAEPPALARSVLTQCFDMTHCTTPAVEQIEMGFDRNLFKTYSWLPTYHDLDGRTLQWTITKDAGLSLPALISGNYRISSWITAALPAETLDRFALRVNDHVIPLTIDYTTEGQVLFEGLLPVEYLNHHSTELQFSVAELTLLAGATQPLGVAVDQLRIEPTDLPSIVEIEFDHTIHEPGWRTAEVQPDGTTFQWMTAKESSLYTHLHPDTNYRLTVRALDAVEPDLFDSFGVAIDDQPLEVQRTNDEQGLPIYSGFVSSEEIGQPFTKLIFSTDRTMLPDGGSVPLSVALDWVRLEPLAPLNRAEVEFDQTLTTAGWRRPEVSPEGMTYQWMIAKTASLEPLSLVNTQDYVLTLNVINAIDPDTLDELSVEVNGKPVKLHQTKGPYYSATYTAMIPQTLLTSSFTQIDLIVDALTVPEGGEEALGLAFDWVRIDPAQP